MMDLYVRVFRKLQEKKNYISVLVRRKLSKCTSQEGRVEGATFQSRKLKTFKTFIKSSQNVPLKRDASKAQPFDRANSKQSR
jgi:hypothetical protein